MLLSSPVVEHSVSVCTSSVLVALLKCRRCQQCIIVINVYYVIITYVSLICILYVINNSLYHLARRLKLAVGFSTIKLNIVLRMYLEQLHMVKFNVNILKRQFLPILPYIMIANNSIWYTHMVHDMVNISNMMYEQRNMIRNKLTNPSFISVIYQVFIL